MSTTSNKEEQYRLDVIKECLIRHLYKRIEDIIHITSILHCNINEYPSALVSLIYALLSSRVISKQDLKIILDNIEKNNTIDKVYINELRQLF